MAAAQENRRIYLARRHLDDLPDYGLPDGFGLRWYQPGDERSWYDIQLAADKLNVITRQLFAEQFGGDADALGQRQCYIIDRAGQAVGTCTAWFNQDWRGSGAWGRVHWMAVMPAAQGCGLGRTLMTITCGRLRELGHRRVYLSTSTARQCALDLYLKFGFEPMIETAEDEGFWRGYLNKAS